MGRRVWIWVAAVSVVNAGGASAAPHPIDQPDLDGETAVALSVDATGAPSSHYAPDDWSLITTVEATYRLAALGASVSLSAPLIVPVAMHNFGVDLHVGNVTATALVTRPVAKDLRAGLGVGLTAPSTTHPRTGKLSYELVPNSYRYFDDGFVGQLHADARWRRDVVTVQGQLGFEDYIIPDWRDQLLLRAALAVTAWRDPLGLTVEGTLLSDAIDENADEGFDVISSLSFTVQGRWRCAMLGVHVTQNSEYISSVGLDVSFPVSW